MLIPLFTDKESSIITYPIDSDSDIDLFEAGRIGILDSDNDRTVIRPATSADTNVDVIGIIDDTKQLGTLFGQGVSSADIDVGLALGPHSAKASSKIGLRLSGIYATDQFDDTFDVDNPPSVGAPIYSGTNGIITSSGSTTVGSFIEFISARSLADSESTVIPDKTLMVFRIGGSSFDLTTVGSILPAEDCTFTLGSSASRWTDLWLCSTIHYDSDLNFQNNLGQDRLTITEDGNVGIGTTVPSASLHISSSNLTSSFRINSDNDSSASLFVSASGEVGIGTDPVLSFDFRDNSGRELIARLTGIQAGGKARVQINAQEPTSSAVLSFSGEGSTKWSIGRKNDDLSNTFRISTDLNLNDSSTHFLINDTGNIGIGVTNPDTRLDINGAFTLRELSVDPGDPDEGSTALWMSNGTGSGDDGDIMIKITAGGTTKTITLVDFSAF